MGTYLCLSRSNSITQKEWEKVYEETLFLADKLDLADWDKFYYKGIRSYAYCKVKEHTGEDFGEKYHFWRTCGDYCYLRDGEYFRLEREIDKKKYNKDAGPAIILEMHPYANITSSPLADQIETSALKTGGGFYHVKLLAIFCFLESKFKEKIFISGDIDRDMCKTAVSMVNKFLEKPIELPARCDFNRLYEIVKTLDISDERKILLMEETYLGTIDLQYKNFIEKKFDKEILHQFWENRFKDCAVKNYEFERVLEAYLSYGFDFKDIFSYISFTNPKEEYLKILELIIEIENKKDYFSRNFGLTRDPEDNCIRGFSLEFRRALFGPEAAASIPYKRYTFDDYVNELSKYFGEQIDVRNFLKDKIKDVAEDTFIARLKEYCDSDNYILFKGEEKYDIIFSRELMYYKTGDKISPDLLKEIKETLKANKKRLNDKKFRELETKDPTEQIYELIDIRHQFPARVTDWIHTIDYFNSHSDALKRYYPVFCMRYDYYSLKDGIAKALFINDDFYEFCKSL